MELYASPQGYLYNLHTVNRKEARKMWRRRIKEQWDNQCAYCGSTENLTIDHVIPKSKGGTNFTQNVVCSCLSCNGSKANTEWQEWYLNQEFFQEANKRKIQDWIGHQEDGKVKLYRYKPRRNFIPGAA
tara:strand:+ start:1298 stop:1684 length:387 start_codon:yes stop_codon:yes gene_type:complete